MLVYLSEYIIRVWNKIIKFHNREHSSLFLCFIRCLRLTALGLGLLLLAYVVNFGKRQMTPENKHVHLVKSGVFFSSFKDKICQMW